MNYWKDNRAAAENVIRFTEDEQAFIPKDPLKTMPLLLAEVHQDTTWLNENSAPTMRSTYGFEHHTQSCTVP